MSPTKSSELKSLLKKYGIILIVFFILNNFIVGGLASWISNLIYPDNFPNTFGRTYSLIVSSVSILINSLIAVITLADTRKSDLRWLIFFITLVAPSVGVIFLFVSKLITTNDDEPTRV